MTTKDYIKLAGAIKTTLDQIDEQEHYVIGLFAENLCDTLKVDNPLFNRVAFLKAAGVPA